MNSISCLGVSIGANVTLITGYLNINISRVILIIGSLDWETPVKENNTKRSEVMGKIPYSCKARGKCICGV